MKITKTFTIIALLCISIVVIGCAKPSPIPIPLVPQITGSWEMVSIEIGLFSFIDIHFIKLTVSKGFDAYSFILSAIRVMP